MEAVSNSEEEVEVEGGDKGEGESAEGRASGVGTSLCKQALF